MQNGSNRDNILNNKNKLNDTVKNKYENPKKTTMDEIPKSLNTQPKNDTYESVCPPDDAAERLKMAQRHSIAVTGNNTISSAPVGISNGSMPSNNSNCINNNNRALKRVISAPVASNDTKGN